LLNSLALNGQFGSQNGVGNFYTMIKICISGPWPEIHAARFAGGRCVGVIL
jgi:hypothetical protein